MSRSFEIDQKVRVKQAVFIEGYDLSNKEGYIDSINSYIYVYIKDYKKSFKLFAYEIEKIPDPDFLDEEDVNDLFNDHLTYI